MLAEQVRLDETRLLKGHWNRWGPYLSERQWGTVREDYSPGGTAWEYLPHEHARSRAYRWGEDGLGGISDRHQLICFSLALWNGRDPILKERLFGLSGNDGNHGEDVKEYYFYLDSTPTHSYMKYLYKYPHAEFPYAQLLEETKRRSRTDPEFELVDTGIFEGDRYFDVFIEYAKATPEDILIRVTAFNRGPEPAELHLLPTLWFRNIWSWGPGPQMDPVHRPFVRLAPGVRDASVLEAWQNYYGTRWLVCGGEPEFLFTENETNFERLFESKNTFPYVKDAFHEHVIRGDHSRVNPAHTGTKSAAHYKFQVPAGGSASVRLRFQNEKPVNGLLGNAFEEVFALRQREADEFYAQRCPPGVPEETRKVQRQAFAGMCWNKQFYGYDVRRWLDGDPTQPSPPPERHEGRNCEWTHLYNSDVISMPDKWEFPWYATWDLAFHCYTLALIDPDFAKRQLLLFLREWYMHPNGQLPAYEWSFSDVNPPVHAAAAYRVYKIEERVRGKADVEFLEKVFHKLLINFTWWVNRKDPTGKNVFEGGFLGLDNIGVFDRSKPLPTGGRLEQSDGTSWMGSYCLSMLGIALELSKHNRAYEDVASKFFEHFIYIAAAMNDIGGKGISLWDEQDGFYYDVLHPPSGVPLYLRIRSMVGLIPLYACQALDPELLASLPEFTRRMNWFLENVPYVKELLDHSGKPGNGTPLFLSLVSRKKLVRVLRTVFDENEFLSPYGIRSLSKFHQAHPFTLHVDGAEYRVDYEPGESSTSVFGGNSNWRGPIWFPVNFLLIEALQRFDHYFGEDLKVEFPTGSGRFLTLWEISLELSRRLTRLFLPDSGGRRPCFGDVELFQRDSRWHNYLRFNEYFHADTGRGCGASQQTGWTGLVAKLIEQSGGRK